MTAMSVVILHIAVITVVAPVGVTAIAGLCPLLVLLQLNTKSAVLTWLSSALLGFLLVPDKTVCILYAFCFGGYPLLKYTVDTRYPVWLAWLVKLSFANTLFILWSHLFRVLMMPFFPAHGKWVLTLVLNSIFIAYDYGLSNLIGFMQHRFKKIT